MLVIAHSCGFIQSRIRNIEARASRRKDRSRDKLKGGSDARDLASPFTQSSPVKRVKHGVYAILINTPV